MGRLPRKQFDGEQVLAIRLAYRSGNHTMQQLAGMYNTKASTISQVIKGEGYYAEFNWNINEDGCPLTNEEQQQTRWKLYQAKINKRYGEE